MPTKVAAEDNPEYGTEAGNDTTDNVFLLSISEVEQYFTSDEARICEATDYAIAHGAEYYGNFQDDGAYPDRVCWWWLRAPGHESDFASLVFNYGSVNNRGGFVNFIHHSVRPAVWVRLSEDASTVGSQSSKNDSYVANELNEGDFQVGNYIQFGTYPQTQSGTDETPIEWLVLARDNDKALLISRYALAVKAYNDEDIAITWENCTLRAWLNGEFYNQAFSTNDKKHIVSTYVMAKDNPRYDTDAGNDTADNVFLLSISEAEQYFENDEERACEATICALGNTAYVVTGGECKWWLRSPGDADNHASDVSYDGSISYFGDRVDRASFDRCVRPAVWVRIF